MKLFYFSFKDVRKNRADCVSIMKSCKEFKKNGFEVILITPYAFRLEYYKKKNEIWDLYGMEKFLFEIVELPTLIWDKMFNYPLILFSQLQQFVLFFIYFLLNINTFNSNDTFIYSKNYIFLFVSILFKKYFKLKFKSIVDYPAFTRYQKTHEFIFKFADLIVANKAYHVNVLKEQYNVPIDKIISLNFVSQYEDFEDFLCDKQTAREQLRIISESSIALYAGKIAPHMKEIRYYLETSQILKDIDFYLVGVKEEDKAFFNNYLYEKKIKNVYFVDFQPLNIFFKYLQAADILLCYYPSDNEFFRNQVSPAKSSLYSISKRPVILPDLPSLRDVFNDEQVFFVEPDNPKLLAEKISYILENPDEAKSKTDKLLEFAISNSYSNIFKLISDRIKNL